MPYRTRKQLNDTIAELKTANGKLRETAQKNAQGWNESRSDAQAQRTERFRLQAEIERLQARLNKCEDALTKPPKPSIAAITEWMSAPTNTA